MKNVKWLPHTINLSAFLVSSTFSSNKTPWESRPGKYSHYSYFHLQALWRSVQFWRMLAEDAHSFTNKLTTTITISNCLHNLFLPPSRNVRISAFWFRRVLLKLLVQGTCQLFLRVTCAEAVAFRSLKFRAPSGTANPMDKRVFYHQARDLCLLPSQNKKSQYTISEYILSIKERVREHDKNFKRNCYFIRPVN